MKLHEVKTLNDLTAFYESQNLHSTEKKVSYLKNVLKIRISRNDTEDTLEEELQGLQELVLTHLWEGLQK